MIEIIEREIQENIKKIEELKVAREKAMDSAWKARTFTQRDEIFNNIAQMDLQLQNLQWRNEYLEEKKRKAAEPVVETSIEEKEPVQEGTVESILEFFGEQ